MTLKKYKIPDNATPFSIEVCANQVHIKTDAGYSYQIETDTAGYCRMNRIMGSKDDR
jgi:hypothetical protein